MSSTAAIAIAIALHLLLLGPLVLTTRQGPLGNAAMTFYPSFALALIAGHFGYFEDRTPPSWTAGLGDAAGAKDPCDQLIDQVKQAGLVLDDAEPGRIVVLAPQWRQLPDQFRTGIQTCYRLFFPDYVELEVIEAEGAAEPAEN